MRFLDEGRQAATPSGAPWHDDIKLNRSQQGAGPRGDQGCLYRPRSERRRSPLQCRLSPAQSADPERRCRDQGSAWESRDFKYEPGLVMADGDYVSIHGRYTGWGPKPMIAVDIFRVANGKIAEHWDVMQEEVPAAQSANGNSMFIETQA